MSTTTSQTSSPKPLSDQPKSSVPPPDPQKPSPGPPTPTRAGQAEIDARTIAELAVPGALGVILGGTLAGSLGTKIALEEFMMRAGSPTDPVERCLLEQYFLAHHRLARLQADAATTKTVEGSKVFCAAAVRLLGEMRRLALTIRQYRSPLASRSFSVIHQQNVAASGGQQDVKFIQKPGQETLVSRDGTAGDTPAGEEDLRARRERVARGEQPVRSGVTAAASI